ncbi:hypothetical protein [Staphylococcus succinus]|uniref:hypothetical protein n=1 Tax=Staphylococcus succinus TaxID=61015 RepID=UPI000E683FC0|nr:hypothetical protein [Staphylococcus succinus]RIN43263.1 hypothetical protein BU059_06200 [Staphylococcus succinus]
MLKKVFKYNGMPTLIDDSLSYDFEYTETAPPEGIYSPFFFDGTEWIGTSKEEFESINPPTEYEPTNTEMQLATTQMQLTKTASQLQETQNQLADAMLEIAKLKGEI